MGRPLDNSPKAFQDIMQLFGEFATEQNAELYLVGGFTRELLAKSSLEKMDIDLMLYPSHEAFIKLFDDAELVSELGLGKVTRLDKFKKYYIARVYFSDGLFESLDISGARKETYPDIAASPIVEAGSVKEDLERRDFTVNAIALSLAPKNFSEIIDPLDGVSDLEKLQLRVIHPKSFHDDPIRLIRGARLMGRFGYKYEAKTNDLVEQAIAEKLLAKVNRRRLINEIKKAVFEEKFFDAFPMLVQTGVFEVIGVSTDLDQLMQQKCGFSRLAVILEKANLIEKLKETPEEFPFSKSDISEILKFI